MELEAKGLDESTGDEGSVGPGVVECNAVLVFKQGLHLIVRVLVWFDFVRQVGEVLYVIGQDGGGAWWPKPLSSGGAGGADDGGLPWW